jgi:hypothetical protein
LLVDVMLRPPPVGSPDEPTPVEPAKRVCKVEHCERKVHGHGLCQLHWRRQKDNGHPLAVRKPWRLEGACQVDGCPKQARAKGRCAQHRDVRTWKQVVVAGETWREVRQARTWQDVRQRERFLWQPNKSFADPDTPLIRLARAAINAGWPLDLVTGQLPGIVANWPERAGDQRHEQHLANWRGQSLEASVGLDDN